MRWEKLGIILTHNTNIVYIFQIKILRLHHLCKKKNIHLKASILNSIILYLNDNFQTFELLLR